MSNLNQVQLIGRIGKEPEIRTLDSGSQLANFSVATSEKWTDKNTGEKKEKTEWHNIVAWGKQVEVIDKYAFKGQLVFIQGSLQTRQWEKDGVTRYSTDIRLNIFQMLAFQDSKPAAAPATDGSTTFKGEPSRASQAAATSDDVEDLPF